MLREFGFPPSWAELTEIFRLGTYYGFIYGGGRPLGPMIKWTLDRGSEESSIVASGTHYLLGYHKVYALAGTTGPLEDGKIQVDLRISYTAVWQAITMTGHFNSEENSLRGTTTWGDDTVGEFMFKRDPDFVRFYPAPSTIDARARWKFAKEAILNRIRRQSWSAPHIRGRIKDGKRYMELVLRYHYGESLDNKELDEYDDLLSSLYEADARFYASQVNVKLDEITIQYVDDRLQSF